MATTLTPPPPTAPRARSLPTDTTTARVETAPRPTLGTPFASRQPVRDPFVDAVRAAATVSVLGVHWLMPQVAWDGAALSIGNSLAGGLGWLVTWVMQVLPLLFFAAGAASGLGRTSSTASLLRRRTPRLAIPVLVFTATWVVLALALPLAGVPDAAVDRAIRIVPQPLWFLGVYLTLLALTPLLRRMVTALGWAAPAILALLPVAVDLLRFTDVAPGLAWLNLLGVWVVPYTVGLAYAQRGAPRPGARTWWVSAAVALVAMLALIATGPYPISLIGMPGDEISNLGPPTVLALVHAVAQVAVVLALREPIVRLATGPLGRAVRWVSDRSMTLYLWHLTAMFTVIGVGLLGFSLTVPLAWTAEWFLQWPLWCAAAAGVLLVLVRVFHRFEQRG